VLVTVPKNFKLIGGGGGGPVGIGGPVATTATGRAGGRFFTSATGATYVIEKMFRPVPEYTRFSVLNIAFSSRVGSRLLEVLAIFDAATPGAVAAPAGRLLFAVWPFAPLLAVVVLGFVTITGGACALGGGPELAKNDSYA
jgi:hypothetical protein